MKYIFVFLIKIYQLLISPQKGIFRNLYLISIPCRFEETCSEFACREIKEKGVVKGVNQSLKRISQCHPFKKINK